GAGGAPRVVAHGLARSRGDLPPGGGSPRGPVPHGPQRGDDARAVEDRSSGRDRRGVRADRLLAFQRRLRRGDLSPAAVLVTRILELRRAPAARGVRFRGHAVQLHLDRRQLPDGGGDRGETVGRNIRAYRSYPRIVGETGGKNFVLAHPSADVGALATALTRGAFEYQGQKCSAASRAFIPVSLWPAVKKRLLEQIAEIRVGDPADFGNFMGAVIDRNAFATITGYIDFARRSPDAEVLVGGGADDAKGYFIEPTVILARRPDLKLLREEIFGPVLTVYVFEDAKLDEALRLCDRGSPYALTGAIFARDRAAIARMAEALTHAAGNFYINDKPTGAVVGQQPFGGARASGTNDKA